MKKAFVASLAVLTLSLMVGPLAGAQPPAATDEEIEQAVAKGVAWLANRQNGDGSWGEDWVDEEGNNRDEDKTARTCFVLVKLEERANELAEKYPDLGIESPFDPDYPYSDNVIRGWRYVFDLSRVHKQTLSVQRHNGNPDDPDTNGNGYGIYFDTGGGSQTYTTGICLMALAASRTPDRPSDGGLDFDGDGNLDTFGEIAQEAVDWLAFAQGDWGNDEGGWHYGDIDNNQGNVNTDNSNSGYAVLGLAYAEAEEYRFKCTIPTWVKTELNVWIGTIQDPLDGGSYYDPDDPPEERGRNELRTGNLIFQMTFVGDRQDPESLPQRFYRALDFIEDHWQHDNTDPGWGYNVDPAGYQAMYCLMKGLVYSRIGLIDTDGDGRRDDAWFKQEPPASPAQDFASVLVAQQDDGGSWSGCGWGDNILCTTWALLTLETAAPEGSVPQLPSEIPETSSLVLLGSGLAALASYIGLQLRARRRK
jgi:hypothetical protein